MLLLHLTTTTIIATKNNKKQNETLLYSNLCLKITYNKFACSSTTKTTPMTAPANNNS